MEFIKAFFIRIFSMIIGMFLLVAFFSIIDFITSVSTNTDKTSSNQTQPKKEKKNIVYSKVVWTDYSGNWYNESLRIDYEEYLKSKRNKENSSALMLEGSYGLYKDMYTFDKQKLDLVYKDLYELKKDRSLSKTAFAKAIVSMVQKIPYSLAVQGSCSLAYSTNNDVKDLMDEGYPCDGYVYGGVYSPLEFVYKRKGDCDSRTVFLYTLFKKFNYDVVVLNSDFYAHSILGVNLPAYGTYRSHMGTKYYAWETTAENWDVGEIPPSFNNMRYWYVALQ
tara:strand:- start:1170 stop:2003 length:834 start_codon:yes stop_codon:yes gene_type:complete